METERKYLILNKLTKLDPIVVFDSINWPSSYFEDINNIKAIVLGCDPSNQHSNNLEYVFGIKSEVPLFRQFFAGIKNNLQKIGLTISEVYIQNLCQNYFNVETSNNNSWKDMAEIWIPFLKEELDNLHINSDVPLFLTSEKLYTVLIKKEITKYKPIELYSNLELIPIKAEENYLNRPLIPLYRHRKYKLELKEWSNYVDHIKKYLSNKG